MRSDSVCGEGLPYLESYSRTVDDQNFKQLARPRSRSAFLQPTATRGSRVGNFHSQDQRAAVGVAEREQYLSVGLFWCCYALRSRIFCTNGQSNFPDNQPTQSKGGGTAETISFSANVTSSQPGHTLAATAHVLSKGSMRFHSIL